MQHLANVYVGKEQIHCSEMKYVFKLKYFVYFVLLI